ncbi:hypothetical protein SCHPADRAFT_884303 [Schizopora paradoxa]|uniref:Uncharacterized protein n=1 Tax=Schizopora paradoxa TaxID=27342 RepID=A0A0H2RI04_9AGAM|nr:hypothetical protein SCHPADRAFT_884303 [Schizopora paradoxa]
MDRFDCNGSLFITVSNNMKERIRIRMEHHLNHTEYCDISIDAKTKVLIEEMKDQTASTIWQRIVRENPETELSAKQIYNYWAKVNENVWKLDADAVESAKKVLAKWDGVKTEIINLRDEPGMSTIAFAIKDTVDNWAGNTEELAIDSTCKH